MFYPYYIYLRTRVSGFIKTERQFDNLTLIIVSVFKLYIKPVDREYGKPRTLNIINFDFILFIWNHQGNVYVISMLI